MRADQIAIHSCADLSTEWLTAQLHTPVSAFQTERIGTGQMSECHRVVLEYHGDASGPGSAVKRALRLGFTSAR